MRFLSWIIVSVLYRIRVEGADNVPDEGAAVLVCNHVSFMDPLIVNACMRRPPRFVMYYKIFNIPVLRFIFRTAKAIPIAGRKEDEALLERAFDEVDRDARRRRARLHLSRRRHHARWRNRTVPARHRADSRAPAGAGRADRAARALGLGVQPARFGARPHAPAAAVPRAYRSRDRTAGAA